MACVLGAAAVSQSLVNIGVSRSVLGKRVLLSFLRAILSRPSFLSLTRSGGKRNAQYTVGRVTFHGVGYKLGYVARVVVFLLCNTRYGGHRCGISFLLCTQVNLKMESKIYICNGFAMLEKPFLCTQPNWFCSEEPNLYDQATARQRSMSKRREMGTDRQMEIQGEW